MILRIAFPAWLPVWRLRGASLHSQPEELSEFPGDGASMEVSHSVYSITYLPAHRMNYLAVYELPAIHSAG